MKNIDLAKKVKNISSQMEDVSSQLDTKVQKNEFLKLVDNVDLIKNHSASKEYVNTKIESIGSNKTFKGRCIYNELPISAEIGDYWYVYDRNTNYCWNGSQWFDIGNNLGIGSNSIGVQNLDINIQEDIGEYKENIGLLTENQAYYPNSNVATAFTTNKWSNIIIDNLIDGTVFKVTLSYINPDSMYGIIFTDNQMNVIATDLKGTDTQQNVKDYRIITPKGATKLIVNCFEPSKNDFKVTILNYGKIATRKYVIENSITNDALGKSYYTGDNKLDSSKYERKSFGEVFPTDGSIIELPISEYADLGDGVGYMFNIWFTDGSNIKGTGKVSYLNERGEEITWYAFGNAVTSSYPITGAKKVRIYSLPRTDHPNIENKIIRGFTLSNKDLSKYANYIVNVTYEKVEEIAILKAQQVIEEKTNNIDDKIVTNDALGKSYYIEDNKIDSSEYENKRYGEILPTDGSFIELPISEYANLGDGIGYMFNIWFADGTSIKGTGKVSYLNESGEEITWYAFGNKVVSNYPITGAKKVRIYSLPRTDHPNIENKIIKGFTLSNKDLSDYVRYKINMTYEKVEEIALLKAKQVVGEKSDNINDKILMLPSTNYDNVIRSINRIGYDVYSSNTPPEQSIESFKLAYKKGFRILLCDLRFTKDNIPVCIHDATINSVAKNTDGTEINETITVSEKNLAELNRYDFGIKKGEKYRGTKILTLDEMCKFVKKIGVELYIEVKDILQNEDEKIKAAVNIVRKYGLKNVSWTHDNITKFGNFTKIAPEYRVGIMPLEMNATKINELLSLKTPQNSLFWFAWDTSPLPIEIVNLMQKNNIEFEVGTIDSESSLFDWFNSNGLRQYCTGISSNKIVAGKVILENEINN